MFTRITPAAVLAAALGTATPARAAFYSAAADFSATSNPNGVWSYGSTPTLGGAFSRYPANGTASGVDFWGTSGLTPPVVFHNGTAGVLNFITIQMQSGQLGSHPGPRNEISVVRFTTPAAGSYDLASAFVGIDVVGTTTDVHVLVNGMSIFNGLVNGFGPGSGPSVAATRTLAVGDTVDFAVGFGANGNYFFDSTGVAATLSGPNAAAVPEPAGVTLALVGAAGVAARRLRRGRTA